MPPEQYSQLHEAVLSLDFKRVDTLLNSGCTLNCVNEQDETFLGDVFNEQKMLHQQGVFRHPCSLSEERE